MSLFIAQLCRLTASDRLFNSFDELNAEFDTETINPLDPSKLPAIEEWNTFFNDQNEEAAFDFNPLNNPFSLDDQVDYNEEISKETMYPAVLSPIVLSDFEEKFNDYEDQKVKRKKISAGNNDDEDESEEEEEEEEVLEQNTISNDTDSAIKKYYTLAGKNRYQCNHPECSYRKAVILCKAKEHNNTHTGERPFKCKVCRIGFAQKANLNQHQKTCTLVDQTSDNSVEYACKTCNKNCNTMTNLIQHLKKNHPDSVQLKIFESKYKKLPDGQRECTLCKRILSANIKHHYDLTHTPSEKRPLVCDLCPSFFNKDYILKSHILKCHSKSTTE